jgi:hypothetical protein
MIPAGSRLVLSGAASVRRGRCPAMAHPSARLARRKAGLWALLLTLLLSLAQSGVSWATPPARTAPEQAVKAEFIERFTRFIDWPDAAFASPGAPFVVCAWGRGPLTSQLEQAVTRQPIKGRPVRFLHVESRDGLESCHLLYVATPDRAVVRGIVASTRGKPLLSVGDQPGFAEEGVLINLFLDTQGFVRFEINLDAARLSGLKISAKLMRLARSGGSRK